MDYPNQDGALIVSKDHLPLHRRVSRKQDGLRRLIFETRVPPPELSIKPTRIRITYFSKVGIRMGVVENPIGFCSMDDDMLAYLCENWKHR